MQKSLFIIAAILLTGCSVSKEIAEHPQQEIIYFYAEWCGPCQDFTKSIDALSAKYKVTKVDVDRDIWEPMDFGIRSVPAVIFLQDGKVINKLYL